MTLKVTEQYMERYTCLNSYGILSKVINQDPIFYCRYPSLRNRYTFYFETLLPSEERYSATHFVEKQHLRIWGEKFNLCRGSNLLLDKELQDE